MRRKRNSVENRGWDKMERKDWRWGMADKTNNAKMMWVAVDVRILI